MNDYLADVMTLLRDVAQENEYPDGEFYSCSVGRPMAPEEIPPGTPAPLSELATAAANLICGYSVEVRPLTDPGQYPVGSRLNEAAGIENGDDYRLIGLARDNPLLFHVPDGSVWRVPFDGGLWYQECRVEKLAASIEDFITYWIAGPMFPNLAGQEGDDLAANEWYRLLILCDILDPHRSAHRSA
ncbi:hypothetical protein [Kitasatospora sp. NPDC050543]|uniref:hypothetical protein n=1 Tax=Kitasatospora sp. NPDC050543 TaxID=3364054 RepID=UPI0037959CF6